MRKIVANSTPLIALNKISRLDLLEKIYGEIIIPYAVYEEAKRLFVTSLHKGEVEVIILAKEIEADLCIIDDLLARKYAKYYDFSITGTIGVVLKAKELGIITQVRQIMNELMDAGIYVHTNLYNKVLEIAGEE